jgi:putative phosphoesterase
MGIRLEGSGNYLVGVISDTHGHLPPEGMKVFENADLIIHAGDIGKPEILHTLRGVAPVCAVRGNMDSGGWARRLPEKEIVEIGEVLLYVLHDGYDLDVDPAAAGLGAVITGHTHKPLIERRAGVLFLNPGSAGPYKSPATVALLRVRGESLEAELVALMP